MARTRGPRRGCEAAPALPHVPPDDISVQDVANHPLCHNCSILLEPLFNEKTLCRCGKYHNAPSAQDTHYCCMCMGEDVPTGTPKGEP